MPLPLSAPPPFYQVKKMSEHENFVNSCCPLKRGPPLLVSGSDDGTAKVGVGTHRERGEGVCVGVWGEEGESNRQSDVPAIGCTCSMVDVV